MQKRLEKGKIIVIGLVLLLILVACYEFYVINVLKNEVNDLNNNLFSTQNQLNQISKDKEDLNVKYGLLTQDVAEIYKGCIKDNACKGRYPNVSWYCNNVGDEVSDPSHICKCDSSCNLVAKQI